MKDHKLQAMDLTLAMLLGRLASIITLMNEARDGLETLEAPDGIMEKFDRAGTAIAVIADSIGDTLTGRVIGWAESEGILPSAEADRMN